MHKTRMTVLVAMMALLLVASAGFAYAVEANLGPGNDTFTEDNDPQCENDTINGGRGTDRLRFDTSRASNCPTFRDVDVGNGGRGGGDVVNVADRDEQDTASGGRGAGDRCIIGVDQNGTADTSDDTRDVARPGCEIVEERPYDQPPPP